ncbi:MAG: ERAP1-like C-terminal domain-containing protein, partial [Actinomycetota bacterium]
VQTAEVNFDGITYAKGASVLKQLAAYVGVEQFLAGLRDYFTEHAYGNTTLADLLGALERSSGRELGSWSKLWLETAGINTIWPEFTLDESGHYATFDLVQSAPNDIASSNVVRPHRLAIGLYHDDPQGGQLVRTGRVELEISSERTAVEQMIGLVQSDLLLVNDDDLAYCKLRLDERSLRTLRAGGIGRLAESLPRALAWSAAWDMTRDGELATRDYLRLVLSGAAAETDIGLLQSINRHAIRALELYADPAWAPQGFVALASHALDAARAAEPSSDHQLAWTHAFVAAAQTEEHTAVLQGLRTGDVVIDGLAIDDELRWLIVQALSARGAIGEDVIAAELERDPSAAGQRHAATARALEPTAEAKARAWQLAVEDDNVPNSMQEAIIAGFAHRLHGELLVPYVERYFAGVPEVWRRRTSELAQQVVIGLFPTWPSTITDTTLAAADAFLAQPQLPPALRRLVGEGRADVARALRARAVDEPEQSA